MEKRLLKQVNKTHYASHAFEKSDKDCVPITLLSGYWRLTPIELEQVMIEYETFADPAGDIPSWLANSFVVDQPLGTLKTLRQRVETKRYTLPETFNYIQAPETIQGNMQEP